MKFIYVSSIFLNKRCKNRMRLQRLGRKKSCKINLNLHFLIIENVLMSLFSTIKKKIGLLKIHTSSFTENDLNLHLVR